MPLSKCYRVFVETAFGQYVRVTPAEGKRLIEYLKESGKKYSVRIDEAMPVYPIAYIMAVQP